MLLFAQFDCYKYPGSCYNYDIINMQVSTEGYFSVGDTLSRVYNVPQRFSSSSPFTHFIAPFWSNSDISNRVGNVSYEVHTRYHAPNLINLVSSFISQQQQVQFNGTWMLVARWNNVPQFGGSLTDVSTMSYPRQNCNCYAQLL